MRVKKGSTDLFRDLQIYKNASKVLVSHSHVKCYCLMVTEELPRHVAVQLGLEDIANNSIVFILLAPKARDYYNGLTSPIKSISGLKLSCTHIYMSTLCISIVNLHINYW